MSIGKFFILAILLPMATIYLTLTLKGERHEIVELEDEQEHILELENLELEKLNSENFKMVFEVSEPSLNDPVKINQATKTIPNKIKSKKQISEKTPDKNNTKTQASAISKSTIFTLDNSSQSGQLFTSIEAMIKFKKNKGKNNPETKNYSNIFNDDSDAQKNIKNRLVAAKKPKVNKSKRLTQKTNSKVFPGSNKITKKITKQIAKITKPKLIKKPIVSQQNRTQIKTSKKLKRTKHKKPLKQKKVSVRNDTTRKVSKTTTISSTENQQQQKRSLFKKQEFPKKRKLDKNTQELLSRLQENNFGDVFDDDGEPDIDIADVDPTDTSETSNSEETTKSKNKSVKKERFTSNPCSGGSARYIARCRK